MEIAVLAIFCAALIACVATKISILYALAFGLIIFLAYGKIKHFSWRQLGSMVISGVRTVRGILIVFLLIGILTAVWRTSGTIPVIIALSMDLVKPHLMILLAFLLNCMISVLTGTAFGTAATMGVICMTMGTSMGVNPILLGGAILSGVFFGDRCSPVSTSALLVAQLTHTNIFTNIRNMLKTAAVPFALTVVVYGVAGALLGARPGHLNIAALFSQEFDMRWFMIAPAVLLLVLAVCRVDVKISMSVSIVAAGLMSVFVQGVSLQSLGAAVLLGFHASVPRVGSLLNGGGIVSMLNVTAIVCLSSAYAGIFERTGLLDGVKAKIGSMESRVGLYAGTLVTSVFAGMVACNQTLAIMLTHQMCGPGSATVPQPQREHAAINLEDSAVVVSALVPWSIACAVPLTSAGAPMVAVAAACYLYLLPLSRLVGTGIRAFRRRLRNSAERVGTSRAVGGLSEPSA